jgi:hypothetical protein
MQRQRVGNQRDLFQRDQPTIHRAALERAKLLPLLRSLLLEVVFGANTERSSTESDHD